MRVVAQQMTGQPNRLPDRGLVDRSRALSFRFDGRTYSGYQGDTLASALLAGGVKLVGRSFKYHRPRGILSSGSEEPNALVELRTGARREANTRATVTELFDGLDAQSQNRWPSLRFDVGAVNSLLSPLLVAGFYYKTFMWPAALWEKLYEPAIRRAAGLGRASMEPDPDTYEKAHAFCDVLIIGGGPAGLSAALSAGRSGARVILCDEDFILGGRLNAERRQIDDIDGVQWAREVERELASMREVRMLRRTTVFGAYDGGTFGAIERVADHLAVPLRHQPRQRLWKIVAKRVLLAAGATERPIVFGGNDRPRVMMASAARAYLNRFGVAAGARTVIFTTCDDGWKTAFDFVQAGIAVEAILDTRCEPASALLDSASRLGLRIISGAKAVESHGAYAVSEVSVRDRHDRQERLQADLLCMSGGWNPNIALTTHLGQRPRWSDHLSTFVPSDDLKMMVVAGAARGSLLLVDALREGAAVGARLATETTGRHALPVMPVSVDDEPAGGNAFWHVGESTQKAFVDFQHDVTRDDIALAAREGFHSVEHLKRYTTLGMGTDQGKTSNVNGLAILAALTKKAVADIGTTAFRPPYTPVTLGALAGSHRGKHFRPVRLTAGHEWAKEQGATFVEAGSWLRAQWFGATGESDWLQTVSREVKAVRSSVGVCDVSTLGKIDIQGSDAARFLDGIYINMFSTLAVGKVRYGLMLREDGLALDDGTTAHLSAGHYIMSTTTANAAKIMQHLEFARQVLWPELDVQIVSVTDQWSQYAIAGPNSRRLLERLLGDSIDISNAAFPYLACIEFSWRGIPARLFRISFSGELAYELAVPARYGDATVRAIMAAGADWEVTPYGTEALGVMRIEKGHVAGNELNGTTTASDLGLGRMMSTKKHFIGRVMARRAGLTSPERPTLVGIKPVDRKARLHAGAHFLDLRAEVAATNDHGYVTSVAFSPTFGHWIGLGFLAGGLQHLGKRVRALDLLRNEDVEVEVGVPVFLDSEGERLRL